MEWRNQIVIDIDSRALLEACIAFILAVLRDMFLYGNGFSSSALPWEFRSFYSSIDYDEDVGLWPWTMKTTNDEELMTASVDDFFI
jgi:hypothetical protein